MLLVSVRVSYSSTPGHAVAVSFRCGKTDTEFPRSKVKLDSAFLRNSGGRSSPFSGHGRVNKSSYVVPLPKQAYGGKSSPVGTLLLPARAPLLKASTRSACPLWLSRTLPYVRSASSATVEQGKPDTVRRASGDCTTSGQINRTMLPLNAEGSQLSLSRMGSEPLAPLCLRQRPSSAIRAPSSHCSRMSDGANRPGSVRKESPRAPGALGLRIIHCFPPKSSQTVRRSLTLHLSIQRRRWCCSGSPPPFLRSGPDRHLSWVTCRIPARSILRLRGKPAFPGPPHRGSHCVLARFARTSASVKTCAMLTTRLATAFDKTPSLPAHLPRSYRTRS